MKTITIQQPYASLIGSGSKWVENRSWPTEHRGPLAIHAGESTRFLDSAALAAYPTGCVIAVVELVDCLNLHDIRHAVNNGEAIGKFTADQLQDILRHEYTAGPFCWVLRNPRLLNPALVATGRLGMWDMKEELFIHGGD